MRTPTNPIVILSFNSRTSDYEVGVLRARGFRAKAVYGTYKGVQERSYVVEALDNKALDTILHLAWLYRQECVLYCDDLRKATLIYSDGRKVPVGHLEPISIEEARKRDSSTYDPETGLHYGTN